MADGMLRGRSAVGLVALLVTVILAPGAAAAPKQTRYSLVHGCYALRSVALGQTVAKQDGGYVAGGGAAEPFRMQATDLGRYLLYGSARDFLALGGSGVTAAAQPSDDSDWTVSEAGTAFEIVNEHAGRQLAVGHGGALTAVAAGSAGDAGRFEFVSAEGCPEYPEVEVNASGGPVEGATSYGEVSGLLEGHLHGMAYEFLGGRVHCGRPFDRFGAPYALRDCVDHQAGNGCAAVLENVLYGNPARCHDPGGWPTFAGWPDRRSLTHEQTYWKWIERAWRGGLRVYVNLMVENRALCELYPLKQNSCDEMDSVLLQIKDIYAMQDYIDAQAGGPGRGFFRIVTNPFEARRVANEGKLAVVLGMETSEPFGCGLRFGNPTCNQADIDFWLDRLKALGLSQFEIVNKFDNGLTGVAGDGGETGAVTNSGNFYATGRYWDMEHCDDPENSDRAPSTAVVPHNDDLIIANGLSAFLAPGVTPVYPEPPLCNTLGLSNLGEYAIRGLIDRHLIFDPDHMSVKGRDQALNLVESEDYSGIISSHSWSTPNTLPRVYGLGGIVTPYAGDSEHFVTHWQELRADKPALGRQYFGVGYGADMNGFGSQGEPRGAGVPNPVSYPFRSFDGKVTLDRQVSGERSFDINTDGVAHYGLYPDWVEDLRQLAGRKIVRDMGRGAEAYLQMWERAEGVPAVSCDRWRQRFLTARGFAHRVKLGDRPKRVLERAGQPVSRMRTWRWCANTRKRQAKDRTQGKHVVATFDRRGRVALIGSTLRKHRADGIRPHLPQGVLKRRARSIGGGVWVRDAGHGREFAYGARGGRVSFVAVVAPQAAQPGSLRRYLRRAGLR